MSVGVLYCEGNSGSYDIRLLRQLLPKCEIKPLGGKSFMEKIIPDRVVISNLAGIVDRDFDNYEFIPTDSPLPYNYEGVQVGWKWQRKEIENYLIDPVVVQRTVRNKLPSMDSYREALDASVKQIAVYTAARFALNYFGFPNSWGEAIKNVFGSQHPFPRGKNKEACQIKIREIVQSKKGERIVTADAVLEKFEELLPSFSPGGFHFENYLTFFAGKDLLCSMENKLREFGFESKASGVNSPIPVFLDQVVKKIEREEDVWKWLPEWEVLREEFINASF
ncbi:DUF4435 domain-containing protein [Cylindrospermum sp. FACHB-282]|uniref:DUF4435 domain-containing protein n=1 Tax=Cylindrospermum sp. FACHB-282 TaxID=2692794 RepID=UPI0016837936|nr:DUF4435 domain-containing protein [Cylindrospermum sp. FACHB-282]MBD2387537.1 DUF4435 domain-containing protein [Cylindrospermum sp. FACHB-282]